MIRRNTVSLIFMTFTVWFFCLSTPISGPESYLLNVFFINQLLISYFFLIFIYFLMNIIFSHFLLIFFLFSSYFLLFLLFSSHLFFLILLTLFSSFFFLFLFWTVKQIYPDQTRLRRIEREKESKREERKRVEIEKEHY